MFIIKELLLEKTQLPTSEWQMETHIKEKLNDIIRKHQSFKEIGILEKVRTWLKYPHDDTQPKEITYRCRLCENYYKERHNLQ